MKKFKLIIRTPEEELVNKEVESLYLTTETGDMMLLPGHSTLSASVTYSKVILKNEERQEEYLVYGGVLFFSSENNTAHLMAQRATLKERVDYDGLKSYLKLVQDRIEKGEDLSDLHIRYLEDEKLALVQGIEAEEK